MSGLTAWFRALLALLVTAAVLSLGVLAGAWWWVHQPLPLAAQQAETSIEPGTPVREIAQRWVQAGVQVPAWMLYEWFRWSGQSRKIRAGSYAVSGGTSPAQLLDKMVQGDESLEAVRFIEGWTFKQVRAAMAQAPHLRAVSAQWSDEQIMQALGRSAVPPEGRFFPDTYRYSKGVSDLTVLRRALEAMDLKMQQAWSARQMPSPLRDPQDMLILASIIEKETGRASDRPLIAGVFHNRMRIGMPLQTDPTVIYGLGEAFDGNLRKADLLRDTPFNTYTRKGLPPTPIAMPGWASLQAAVKPAATTALYFVAKGDGSSIFSATLEDHNRAVFRYQKAP